MENKSFTLIELLVVIVIIGILAGVIIVSVSSSINKANFAKAQAFSNTVQNELLGDLVSEWTFDNPSLPGEDTWGNNDGTVSGATYKTRADGVCVYGGCMSFDGNDYIEVPYNSSLNNPSHFTLYAWGKSNIPGSSYTDTGFIIDIGEISPRGYAIFTSSKRMTGYYNGMFFPYSKNNLDIDWHNYVFTYNGFDMRFYVDGEIQADPYTIGVGTVANNPLRIGAQSKSLSRYWNGLIDDVRIYNTALSSAQIKKQYVAGLNSLLANNNISKEEYNLRIESLSQK